MEKAVEASRKLASNFDWPLWVSRWNSPQLNKDNIPQEKRSNLRRPQTAKLTTAKGSAHVSHHHHQINQGETAITAIPQNPQARTQPDLNLLQEAGRTKGPMTAHPKKRKLTQRPQSRKRNHRPK